MMKAGRRVKMVSAEKAAEARRKKASQAEKEKAKQAFLSRLFISEGVMETPRLKGLVGELLSAEKEKKKEASEKLKKTILAEKERQNRFRQFLQEEIRNDPELRKAISTMNKNIEKVTADHVMGIINLMKKRYEKKIEQRMKEL